MLSDDKQFRFIVCKKSQGAKLQYLGLKLFELIRSQVIEDTIVLVKVIKILQPEKIT